jgi:hypothetical protein
VATLVPGRSCGGCNACCRYFDLMAELNKPCGILCRHWESGVGCGIYETRPPACRNFYCDWLLNDALDDAWRPDRSGMIIRETRDGIPREFGDRNGLIFALNGPDSSLEADRVVERVSALILQGVPVYLEILGPMGFGSDKVMLNRRMAVAAASRNRDRIVAGLREALAFLRTP